jgi:hypothetical protein
LPRQAAHRRAVTDKHDPDAFLVARAGGSRERRGQNETESPAQKGHEVCPGVFEVDEAIWDAMK